MCPAPSIRSLVAATSTLALLSATPAFAHPGHDQNSGLLAGLLHPVSGADHLLAMLLVGVWAAQLGGRARWQVPLAFVALMALGAGLAIAGWAPPQVEAGIIASLVALGLVVATALRLPATVAATLVGGFALFHGAAHGLELPSAAQPLAYAAGFVAMTALLHAAGLAIALAVPARCAPLLRIAGIAGVACGVVLAVG